MISGGTLFFFIYSDETGAMKSWVSEGLVGKMILTE